MELDKIIEFTKEASKLKSKKEVLALIKERELKHKDLLDISDFVGLGLLSHKNKDYVARIIAEHYSGGMR